MNPKHSPRSTISTPSSTKGSQLYKTSRSGYERKGTKIVSSVTGVSYTSPASLLMREVKTAKIAEGVSKRMSSHKPINSSQVVHQIIQNSKVGDAVSAKEESPFPSYDVHIRPTTSKVPHPFSSTSNEFFVHNKQIIENASPIYNRNLIKEYSVPQISLKMKEILVPVSGHVSSSESVSESLQHLQIKPSYNGAKSEQVLDVGFNSQQIDEQKDGKEDNIIFFEECCESKAVINSQIGDNIVDRTPPKNESKTKAPQTASPCCKLNASFSISKNMPEANLDNFEKVEDEISEETYDEQTRRSSNHVKQMLSQHRRSLSQREANSRERKKLLHGFTLEEIQRVTNEICKPLVETE
ncbi:hypothetical protein C9374_004592 [Naegleria lovaniensis]|uniref:Uncharacterized protein n=1 Tax=Naegleria lovaniensis TaxID=51637 RepID=A0AA88KL50_NAELO|nr:uncharacterized protein C9374_004592 [Naegleria lovaniensis]KAG2383255.1 hypothetical protein C9374_004592 [Naegleria lovaniensis]